MTTVVMEIELMVINSGDCASGGAGDISGGVSNGVSGDSVNSNRGDGGVNAGGSGGDNGEYDNDFVKGRVSFFF